MLGVVCALILDLLSSGFELLNFDLWLTRWQVQSNTDELQVGFCERRSADKLDRGLVRD